MRCYKSHHYAHHNDGIIPLMTKPISLTPAERLILVQQLDSIYKLYPEREEECDWKREIIQRGLTSRYIEIFHEYDEENNGQDPVLRAQGDAVFQREVV